MPEEKRQNEKRRSESERRQIEEHPDSDVYVFDRRLEDEQRRAGDGRREEDKE